MRLLKAKGQIMPRYSTVKDDYICRLELSDEALSIIRDECARPEQLLFAIPLANIIVFDYKNPDLQQKKRRAGLLSPIKDFIALCFGLVNIRPGYGTHSPDIVSLHFHDQGQYHELTIATLESGIHRLLTNFQKQTQTLS